MSGASGVRAGGAYYELSLRDGLTKGLRSAQAKLRAFATSIKSIGLSMASFGGGLTAALSASVGAFGEMGAAMARGAMKAGTTVEAFSQLNEAAEKSGVSTEDLSNSMAKLQKKVGEAETGSSTAIDTFGKLGVSINDLKNLSPDQQFELMAEKISNIHDPAQRTAAAMEMFGKSGANMLPMLMQGRAGIEAMRKDADALGLTMSGKDAQAGLEFSQSLSDLWKQLKMVAFQVGAAVGPALKEFFTISRGAFKGVIDLVKGNKEFFVSVGKIAAAVLGAGVAIYGIGVAFSFAAAGVGILASAIGLLFTPIGLIVGGIAAVTAAWFAWSDAGQSAMKSIKEVFGQIMGTAKQAFAGIKDAVAGGDLALAGKIAVNGLRIVFLQGIGALSRSVGGEFGDFTSTIGKQIAGGDISGAWDTVTSQLNATWTHFTSGIVEMFRGAANAIIDIWDSLTGSISSFMQGQIEGGSPFGKLLAKGSGYDPAEEEKIRKNQQRLRQSTMDNLNARKDELLAESARGGLTPERKQAMLAEMEAIAKQASDLVADAEGKHFKHIEASDLVHKQAEQMNKWWTPEAAAARENEAQNQLHHRIAGGMDGMAKELADAQAQQMQDVAHAHALAAKAGQNALKDKVNGGRDSLESVAKSMQFGTFNAATANRQFGGSSPILGKIDRTNHILDQILHHGKKKHSVPLAFGS